ncbi:MAG: bifunctional (p)ppGpp synthetase/guanosine-3',5'-bis(diphosphate) 3'-pyrophosphohydrolase [Sutterella sp.]|uniref:RelA/SpoT family protein n=1 Tax=Duodenibacillus massiliensis TaxID=1852381 RepID=UPI00258EF124|nr:bifunctional (p)ppGpp synthetase/guanosine-3',5'-bis(diphosphate) 3'-pyrophosphohydrolase [uncultured Duodenibacillus sp.]MBS5792088.1 bifunctional (p)ppGpp synthetase/guanosine-3',5'-bis(diphosphate) 3'-pyrophosphohydrolase [Sutterella sp.]
MPQTAARQSDAILRQVPPRPEIPTQNVRHEGDYDEAYLDRRADEIVSDDADLPLYTPVGKATAIATSAQLLARCRQYLSESDVSRIQAAFRYADDAHLGQFRKSGEPYITHPLAVATILAEWHLDAATICAGLMHDVLEDTGVAKIEMAEQFGIEVTEIVDGVSKLDKLRFSSNEIAQAESFRKMLLAMSRDVRVILVKLADRLHNLRTLGVMRPEKRRRIATETLEIYVPIAHRLGLNTVFRELQELSFFNQHPLRYEVLRKNLIASRGKRRAVLERILRETREALPKHHIVAQVQGRDKTIYGIYNRMRDTHASFSDVLDIYGFRVIVRTREECYLALCALHELYKPVHRRFKDFIAIPKANGYQSLHTTVIGPSGTPIEYQIRTEQMHRIDEMGILSHWLYNDGLDTSELQKMVAAWLQSLLEIQRTSADSSEFIENIKIDLFPDRVYVFTPKSKIISLPRGSCPVDFAYQIHTDIGNKTSGCRINGEEKPLTTELKNGDMVEILTADKAQPDPNWLNYVRSGRARAEIRQYLRTRDFKDSVALGETFLRKAAAEAGINFEMIPEEAWKTVVTENETKNRTALFADVGQGKLFAAAVVTRLVNFMRAREKTAQSTAAVSIRGTEGMAVQLATCCHPIPGDTIWGFMRKGHGLSVHRADCEHTVRGRKVDSERWMAADWKEDIASDARFPVPVELEVTDERSALAGVAAELAKAGSAIVGVNMNDNGKTDNKLRLMIQVKDRVHLLHVLRMVRQLPTVTSAARCLDGDKVIRI